jgi:MFS family permease
MLWCISFFNYADRQAIFSVFPVLEFDGRHLTKLEQGSLGSSFALVYGVCAPFAGTVVDRVRRKTAILVGLQVWSLICLATSWSRNFTHLLWFRAAEGLGESAYYPASVSMLSDYHGRRTRSRALGIHQTSVYVGTIGGGTFAGIIAEYFGWRWSFILFGGLGILLGLVLSRFLREPRRGAADAPEESSVPPKVAGQPLPLGTLLAVIWTTPTVLCLMAAFLCANFVAMVLLAWMPSFLYEKFDLSLSMAGFMATIYVQSASLVGAPLGGWLADWLRRQTAKGRILVQALGVLAAAPCVYLCGQSTTVAEIAVILAAWGLFKGIYDANIFAAVVDVVRPEARGTVTGFMNMVGWLGGGVTGPVVIGYLAGHRGFSYAISSAAVVYLAAGFFLLLAAFRFVDRDSVS